MKNIITRIIICSLLLFPILGNALPLQPVLATSTLTIRPNSDASVGLSNVSGSSNHWENIDEVVADDSVTRNYTAVDANETDLYDLEAGISVGVISDVIIYAVMSKHTGSADGKGKILIKTHSTVYASGNIALTDTYTLYSISYPVNPFTGIYWTWAEIDSLEAGVQLYGSAWKNITQLYVTVDYGSASSPVLTTNSESNLTSTTATLNGQITDDGGENSNVNLYWGTTNGGNVAASWTNNGTPTAPGQPQGIAAFYKNVTGLTPNTLYYFNASGNNSAGWGWGTTHSFTTLIDITTQAITSINTTTALGSGNITNVGTGYADIRGFCWATTGTPTIANSNVQESGYYGVGVFNLTMTGLLSNTHYHVRAFTHGSGGYAYGNQVEFTTIAANVPTVITNVASGITRTSATLNGSVNSTGGENPIVTVFWGLTDGGNVAGAWSNNSTPTSPSQPQGATAFLKNISALSSNKLYYFNTSVNNSAGTSWGTTQSFTTLTLGTSAGGWNMIPVPPVSPDNLLTEGGSGFPMGAEIAAAATHAGDDPATWLFSFAFAIAAFVAIFVFKVTNNTSIGQRGSLLLSVMISEGILIYFYVVHTVPGMALVPLGIIGLALIVWRKSPAPME
jgi:hypothetical protein